MEKFASSFEKSSFDDEAKFSPILLKTLYHQADLPDNWDDEGALPIKEEVLIQFWNLLFELRKNNFMIEPDFSPDSAGDIDCWWSGEKISVSCHVRGNRFLCFRTNSPSVTILDSPANAAIYVLFLTKDFPIIPTRRDDCLQISVKEWMPIYRDYLEKEKK